jgi:ribose transport system permease protein
MSQVAPEQSVEGQAQRALMRPAHRAELFGRYAVVVALIILCGVYSILLPNTFPRLGTIQTLLSTQSISGILALSTLFTLVVGEFDLSLGSILGFSGLVFAAVNAQLHWGVAAAIACAIAVSIGLGVFNGILVTFFRMSSFIATLATATLLSGMTTWITSGGLEITGISSVTFSWGNAIYFSVLPIVAVYLVIAAAATWFLLDLTPWGRYMRVVGASPRSAVLIGLPTHRVKLSAFAMGGCLAGIAGVIQTFQLGSGSPAAGPSLLLPAFAAAFVGSTTISPGRFNVPGTIVAVILLAVGIVGLQLLGVPSYVQDLFDGGALIVAVAVSVQTRRALSAA